MRYVTPWLIPILAAAAAQAQVAALRGPDPVQVRAVWSNEAVRPGDPFALAVVFDVADGYHINADAGQLGDSIYVPTQVTVTQAPADLTVGAPQWPAAHPLEVAYDPRPLPTFEGRVAVYLPVIVADDAELGERTIELSTTHQACDDQQCLLPRTQTISATIRIIAPDQPIGAATDPELFRDFDATSFAELVSFDLFGYDFKLDPSTTPGFVLLLLVAAGGGLLLNFTPCVLPVIPIKVMSLSRSAGNRARCLLLGVTMSLGVVAFWIAIAAAIASVTQFDAINELFQELWFTIGVGLVIAVMAVGMCGLFAIRLPRFVYQYSPKHDTLVGSFGFGIMTAVLSTPCTAPFMGSAAAWAVTQQATTTVLTFAAIGAGMALPYLVLSAWPRLVEKMPRTGEASELIKQVMGLLMLAAAAYFIGVGLATYFNRPPDPPTLVYWWAVAAFVAAAGAWLVWRTWRITAHPVRRAAWTAVGLVVLGGSVYGAVELTDRGPIDWVYYTRDRFAEAQGQGQVVVLDFTAEWCLNCKALEHSVLNSDRVAAALQQPGVVPMKVDITSKANVDGAAKLSEVGAVAIPLLMVYTPAGEVTLKSSFYTIEQVVAAIAEAKAGGR